MLFFFFYFLSIHDCSDKVLVVDIAVGVLVTGKELFNLREKR